LLPNNVRGIPFAEKSTKELLNWFFLAFFQIYLINQGKNPNVGIGLEDGFEETIFNKERAYNKAGLPDKKVMGLFCFETFLIK